MSMRNFLIVGVLVVLSGCGGGDPGGGGGTGTPAVPCNAGDCGKQSFRQALPSRASVNIQLKSTGSMGQGLGSKRQAVGDASAAYGELDAYVGQINGMFAAIFLDLETLAGTEPDARSDTMHEWRGAVDTLAGHEESLLIETQDEVTFTIRYAVGPDGFDVRAATPILSGKMVLAENGSQRDFELTLDLDAVTEVDASANMHGDILLRAQPFAGGLKEIWYDFRDVSIGGSVAETSITTYWVFADGSGALEYLADVPEYSAQAVTYARWGSEGGRVDEYATYQHPDLGAVEQVATSCWGGDANSTFDAFAVLDDSGLYGELDGLEADCAFGPLENHPNPRAEFGVLPAEGAWDDLQLQPLEE